MNSACGRKDSVMAGLLAGVVAVARLEDEVLLTGGEVDLVVTVGCGGLGGSVAEAVLGAKFLGYLGVDLGYGLLLRDFEEASACLLGDALEDLLAVDAVHAVPASGTPSRVAA